MESDVISELRMIKNLLFWIVILLTLLVGGNILNRLSSFIVNLRSNYQNSINIVSNKTLNQGRSKLCR